jgi:hypothetical protein
MRPSHGTRLLAVLVAALFLGGAGGAADLDALLFHGAGGQAVAASTHLEPGGAPAHHADLCLLALRLASGRLSAALTFPVRVEGLPLRGPAASPAAAPARFFPGLHQQSRAPPPSAPIA